MDIDGDVIKRLSEAALSALAKKGMSTKFCGCPTSTPEVRIHLLAKYTNSPRGPNSFHPYIAAFCKSCGITLLFHAKTLLGKEEFKRIVTS